MQNRKDHCCKNQKPNFNIQYFNNILYNSRCNIKGVFHFWQLSVFPDADRTWVTENLRSKQLSHPDSFVFYVCEMLIESRHDNRETNSKETSGKKTSPSEHSSKRKTSCSIEKVKNSQKYVDVLSEKADHIEMWNRPFRDVDDDGEPSSPKKPQLEVPVYTSLIYQNQYMYITVITESSMYIHHCYIRILNVYTSLIYQNQYMYTLL